MFLGENVPNVLGRVAGEIHSLVKLCIRKRCNMYTLAKAPSAINIHADITLVCTCNLIKSLCI